MKILQVATGFPISFPGGITNYVRTLSRTQIALGHHVEILSGPENDMGPIDFATAVHQFKGVGSAFCLSVNRDDKQATFRLAELLSKFDIIHFHMGYGLPASFFLSQTQTPYIVSLHDYGLICPRIFMMDKWGQLCESRDLTRCRKCVGQFEQINFVRAGLGRLGWKVPTLSSNAVVKRAERLDHFLAKAKRRLAVSKRVAEIFENAIPGVSCDVVHIGNESSQQIPSRDSWAPNGKIRCGFIGTLNRDKGANVLIDLVRSVPLERFDFGFWGRGEDRYLDELRRLGVACNGAYRPSELNKILQEVDVGLVLPIWNDNGPQVLMEFLNNGIPVLGTNMGGVPDFLTKTTGFIFNPSEGIEDAARWLQTLDETRLAEMHSQIKPLKNPVEHCNEVIDIYSQVLGTEI